MALIHTSMETLVPTSMEGKAKAKRRRWSAATAGALVFALVPVATQAMAVGAPHAPRGPRPAPTLAVNGAVSDPITYTLPELAALPSETVSVTVGTRHPVTHMDTGVSLEALVDDSSPELPDTKNGLLAATVTVGNHAGRQVTFALGELDPSFGDHDGLIALYQDGRPIVGGPKLVVPGDKNRSRSIGNVDQITVGLVNATLTVPPAVGDLDVITADRTVVLTPAKLERLRATTLTVTFIGPSGSETMTESGPTLAEVLRAAHVRTRRPTTWVAGVGSDSYVATVTPAEARVGGRPLLISLVEAGVPLSQPRLIADGDIKGGRDDSDLDDLVVGNGPAGEGMGG